eukprot:6354766-Alexandrium_andersonii.AAC.1
MLRPSCGARLQRQSQGGPTELRCGVSTLASRPCALPEHEVPYPKPRAAQPDSRPSRGATCRVEIRGSVTRAKDSVLASPLCPTRS